MHYRYISICHSSSWLTHLLKAIAVMSALMSSSRADSKQTVRFWRLTRKSRQKVEVM